jgi:hypothetical protein
VRVPYCRTTGEGMTPPTLSRAVDHSKRIRNAVLFVASVTLVLVLLWFAGDPVPVNQKILATVISYLSIIPLVHFLVDRRPQIVPLMGLNGLFYLVAFGVNGFYLNTDPTITSRTTQSGWILGLQLGIIGFLAQLFGYYVMKSLIGTVRPIRVITNLPPNRIRILAWSLMCFRLLMYFIPDAMSIPSVRQLAVITPFITIGLLMMLSMKGHLGIGQRILLYGIVVPFEFAVRLNTGAVYEPVLLLIFLFLVRWVISRKINFSLIAAGVIVYAIFNPIKNEYREVVWRSSTGQQMSGIEKFSFFLELAGNYWLSDQVASEEVRTNLLTRLNHLSMATVATENTPNVIPYWYGESLELGLVAFVPRFLWPNKPSLTFGNQFGVRYGILYETNTDTTVNLTWVVEFYINYGYPAVLLGMALIGVAFALLERWYATPGTTLIDVIIPLSTTFILVYPESNLVMMWGGVITSTIAFYALAWSMVKKS